MRLLLSILFGVSLITSCSTVQFDVDNLKCEHKTNPVGIDIAKPRFSWTMESGRRGAKQTAYRIIVSSTKENCNQNVGDIWDSKKVVSSKSNQIYFDGTPLKSNSKYFWKVIVWNDESVEQASNVNYWISGLLSKSDWKAKWIGLDKDVGDDNSGDVRTKLNSRMLRYEFDVKKEIRSATAFISGLGLFEFYINGEKIGNQVLAPGLTEYNKRTFYLAFDVTRNLNKKRNTIGVILGNGRYFAPRLNFPVTTRTYGYPKMICQIEIKYSDGTGSTIISDELWKLTADGPTRKNNEYDGEFYDAGKEFSGWSKTGFDDSGWRNAEPVDKPGELLVAQPNEPIEITEEITPVSLTEIEPGMFIFDMGQNMVGWAELFVKGKKGDKVTLRFAEKLNNDGTLFLDNLRSAEVTDTYILKGEGKESWEPKFTYHGFRYVEMKGYPGTPDLSSIKGKVIHDALSLSGTFSTSNNTINRIYKNAFWGIRGNYRSMPTDCPQRDERQGWLGDRSTECIGESFVFDVANLYNKWLFDIKDAQQNSGSLPDVAPSYWPFYTDNTTWPGTYLFASEMLYNQYGDLKTIEAHYPNMQKWIEYMSGFIVNGLMPKDTYGDWCTPPQSLKLIHENAPLKTTNYEFIATAYFYYELKLMEKFALLLQKNSDAEKYGAMASEMKIAFNKKHLDKHFVKYSNNTVTANILALAFNLVPPEYKEQIVDNLLQKIMGENQNHIGNGIIGGQWLMRTLSGNGYADIAYILATQTTYPSWGYMVENGATTIWELWNGDTADPGMNSGNHVMLLGDLIIWFYENLAGIKADSENPGFKHIIMRPEIVGDLSFVNASFNSVYGKIESRWKTADGNFNWDITIPANTTATIYVPAPTKDAVFEGSLKATDADGVTFVKTENNRAVFEIQSGSYSFSSTGFKRHITKKYTSIPEIIRGDTTLTAGEKIEVKIVCEDTDAVIKYTTDGSEPDENSEIFSNPLIFSSYTFLKAKAFSKNKKPSPATTATYDFIDYGANGILWKMYRGKFREIPDLTKITPVSNGICTHFDLNEIDVPNHNFVLKFDTNIQIDKKGEYTFYTATNDGSKLYIDNKLVVNNDGLHAVREVSDKIYLKKGMHKLRLEYFQEGGSKTLSVYYKSDEISYRPIPGSFLFKSR
jgi:alpha-L-rhamnosidase